MFVIKYIYFLIFVLGFSQLLTGQCSFVRNIPIRDNDTSLISIVVDSLNNDTLGLNGQALCGVGLDFRYEFLGDISIELISPDGKIVTLAGPAVPVSGNTSFTRWNVTFIPCAELPAPDPGFSEIWDNLQSWGLFGNYTGQYHPTLGCLEEFNGSLANGVWTLRVIDVSQFGSGRVQGVRLFFCDDSGIQCNECRLDPGILSGPPVEKCFSSGGITLPEIEESFSVFPKDTTLHLYRWAIFDDSTWVNLIPQDTILYLPVGQFIVCNLQYAKIEMDRMPDLPALFTPKSMNRYFQDSLLCARVGDSCIQVTVFPSTDTIRVDTVICPEEKIYVFGDTITQPGIYTFSVEGVFCDTVVILTVSQNEFRVTIETETDTIDCLSPLIQLTGQVNGTTDSGAIFNWYTAEGSIFSDPTRDSIIINQPGLYVLEVSEGRCSGSDSITIYNDDEIPEIEIFSNGTLDCRTDTIILSVMMNVPLDTVIWSSTSPFIQWNNQAQVFEPGTYRAEVLTSDGCQVVAFTEIIRIDTVAAFSVEYDSLTCTNDTATASVFHEINGSYTYQWIGALPGYSETAMARFVSGGLKSLVVTDVLTGCTADFIFELIDGRVYAFGEVLTDTLTCTVDSVKPIILLDTVVAGYFWQGPGLSSTDSMVVIRFSGNYTLEVSTPEGCRSVIPFTVVSDTTAAPITLYADSLTCAVDSVYILAESDDILIAYTWYDRDGIIFSNDAQALVYLPGVYTLQAENKAGCFSFASLEVFKSSQLPDVGFTVDVINCERDSVQIVPDNTEGLSFTWQFPDLSVHTIASPFVDESGSYKVTITDILNPDCVTYDELIVQDTREYATIEIEHGQLTCFADSARVQVTISPAESTYYVAGPGITFENMPDFYIKLPGTYEVVASTDSGCETRDTFVIIFDDEHPVINIQPFLPITCRDPVSRIILESDLPGTIFELYKENEFVNSGDSIWISTAGQYQVIGISPNLCRDTSTFILEADTLKPDLFVSPPDTITCSRPEIILTASSSFPDVLITWNGLPQNPLTVSSGGLYTARSVNNQNGCFTEETLVVFESNVSASYETTSTAINCNNALSQIRVSPGAEFSNIIWSVNNPVLFPEGMLSAQTSVPGWYFFEVISTEMCRTKDSVFVERDILPPVIGGVFSTEINCNAPVSIVYAEILTPYDSILWKSPFGVRYTGDTLYTEQPGFHLIEVYGQNGCIKDTFAEVIKNVKPPSYAVEKDSLTCSKGKGIIRVIPTDSIVSYVWTGPEQFSASSQEVLVTIPGLYNLVVINDKGCSDTTEIIIEGDYKIPEFVIQDTFLIPCDSSVRLINLLALDSIRSYYWSYEGGFLSTDPVLYSNVAGTYSIRVTGYNGCTSVKDFELVQVTRSFDFTVQSDTIRCNKRVAYLQANSEDSEALYTWHTPGNQQLNGPAVETEESGLFLLVVEDSNKCKDTAEVFVIADTTAFRTDIIQIGDIVCNQRDILLEIADSLLTDFYTYNWFHSGGAILTDPQLPGVTIRDAGTYRLVVVNQRNGCIGISEKVVLETESSFKEIPVLVTQPPCEKFNFGSISIGPIGGVPPYLVEINGIKFENIFSFDLLTPGDLQLTVTDSLGCRKDTTLYIQAGTNPGLGLPVDTTLYLGDSLIFDLDTAFWQRKGYTIKILEKNDTLCDTNCQFPMSVRPGFSTVYSVILTAMENLCSFQHKILVYIDENIFSSIPNVFSRNAKQEENKTFYIPASPGIEEIIAIEIYDKWANPMFARYNIKPGDPDLGWDGTLRGQNAETGVYVVICKLRLSNGREIVYSGDVTILD